MKIIYNIIIIFFLLRSLIFAEKIDLFQLMPYASKESPWIFINPTDQEGNKFLGMGWGPIDSEEIPARWIVGQKATINLSFTDLNEKYIYLCIKGLPNIHDHMLKLSINQFIIEEKKLSPYFEIIKFKFPSVYQSLSENKIVLEFNIFSKKLPKKYLPKGIKENIPISAAIRWILISSKQFDFTNCNFYSQTDFSVSDIHKQSFILKPGQKITFFEKIHANSTLSFVFLPYKHKTKFPELIVEIEDNRNKKSFTYDKKYIKKLVKLPLAGFDNQIVSISFMMPASKSKIFSAENEIVIQDPFIEFSQQNISISQLNYAQLNSIKEKISSYNLIILLLDAAAANHLSIYGYNRKTTPFIDELAQKGIIFENAFTNASYTLASASTIYTGLPPAAHGVVSSDFAVPQDAKLLSEYFKKAGYKTAAFTGNYFFSKAFGFDQGFDLFYEPPLKDLLLHSDMIVKEAKNWIKNNINNKFFMYIHFREPHVPYSIPKNFEFNFWEGQIPTNKLQELRSVNCTDFTQRPTEEINFIISQYDTLLRYIDSKVAELIKFIDENKLLEKTVIVVLSDHGQSFWQHGIHTHSLQLYDETIKIPMIFYLPHILQAKNKKINNLFEMIDLMPTLLELFNLKSEKDLPGKSFVSCMFLQNCPDKEFVISRNESMSATLFSIRNHQYKLIASKNKKQFELYDLLKDPEEKNNIFDQQNIISKYFLQNLDQNLKNSLKYKYFTPQLSKLTGEMREKLKALGYVN